MQSHTQIRASKDHLMYRENKIDSRSDNMWNNTGETQNYFLDFW